MNVKKLFNDIPDVNFIDVDTGADEANIIALYEAITNTVLYPADPVRLFLSTLAAVISQLKNQINYTGQQNLLRYAQGNYLEHLGAPLGVYRLAESKATTNMLFELQVPVANDVVVPLGTRTTCDGSFYFATSEEGVIPKGELMVVIRSECMSSGQSFNDLPAGSINKLTDPIAGVIAVRNITVTSGGADAEADDDFRERIALAPEKYTTAGSELAYVYHALSAHPNIIDVSTRRLIPGTVLVSILLKGGIPPEEDSAEIQAVRQILNEEKHRPLNDTVIVKPAVSVELDYTMRWYITKEQMIFQKQIASNIEKAVSDYQAWQSSKLAQDVIKDDLIQRCRTAGAKRIEVNGLEYRSIARNEVCRFIPNSDRVSYGGIDE